MMDLAREWGQAGKTVTFYKSVKQTEQKSAWREYMIINFKIANMNIIPVFWVGTLIHIIVGSERSYRDNAVKDPNASNL